MLCACKVYKITSKHKQHCTENIFNQFLIIDKLFFDTIPNTGPKCIMPWFKCNFFLLIVVSFCRAVVSVTACHAAVSRVRTPMVAKNFLFRFFNISVAIFAKRESNLYILTTTILCFRDVRGLYETGLPLQIARCSCIALVSRHIWAAKVALSATK